MRHERPYQPREGDKIIVDKNEIKILKSYRGGIVELEHRIPESVISIRLKTSLSEYLERLTPEMPNIRNNIQYERKILSGLLGTRVRRLKLSEGKLVEVSS